MSKAKGKLCSCGFPQSCPIPHEHDQTVREKAIVKHFENRMRDLVKQRKGLLTACEAIVSFCESKERLNDDGICPTKAYELAKAALEKAKPKPEGSTS